MLMWGIIMGTNGWRLPREREGASAKLPRELVSLEVLLLCDSSDFSLMISLRSGGVGKQTDIR